MFMVTDFDLCVSTDDHDNEVLVVVFEQQDLPILGALEHAELHNDPLQHGLLAVSFEQGQLGCHLPRDVADACLNFDRLYVCVLNDSSEVVFEHHAPMTIIQVSA